MNLDNKIVQVVTMGSLTMPPLTTVTVQIQEHVTEDIIKALGSYTLKFEKVFPSMNDPELLALINEKLILIPD